MLKKLKRKFILNNMLLVSIVLTVIFSLVCAINYIREENRITAALNENLQQAQKANLPYLPILPADNDSVVYEQSFTVLLDEDGSIITQMGNDMPQTDFYRAVQEAFESGYGRGSLISMGLSYKSVSTPQGTLIAFVSREHLSSRMTDAISQAMFAELISILLFLYISKRLADIAIAPVEEAWQQQKQFIADASHDLKTPLTVILANNNILAAHRDETVESQMKWIESTSEEAGRMSDLINKMLELAKNEAAQEELKLGEVNISELVENSILQFEVVAFERSISIESGIQPGIIVRTHAPTLAKVLEILFDNAIKYSDEGGTISIALYQSSKKIRFTINNKGESIHEEDLPHIFERFYRTNKEREVGGHGLGLSLARKKCDLIGAKISVESNPDDGTTFTITLKAKNK